MNATKDQDVAAVLETMDAYAKAMTAHDIDALLALCSDDWRDSHGFGKDDWRDRYKKMKGLEVDFSEAEATVDGNRAKFTPAVLCS